LVYFRFCAGEQREWFSGCVWKEKVAIFLIAGGGHKEALKNFEFSISKRGHQNFLRYGTGGAWFIDAHNSPVFVGKPRGTTAFSIGMPRDSRMEKKQSSG
jgi:hypothetical protein